MARSLTYAQRWLPYDGLRVTVQGIAYTLQVRQYTARYPVVQAMVTVRAEPRNKKAAHYQDLKRQLGDDWSTDVLDSDIETEQAFFEAAQTVQTQEDKPCR